MIFVTVGTTHSFDRLVRAVDVAVDAGLIEEEVFAQVGNATYMPRTFHATSTLSREKFDEYIRDASAVIGHAGVGVLTAAMDAAKPVLVMPRLRRLNEAVNDHQVALAEEYARRGHTLLAHDEAEFLQVVRRLRTFVPCGRSDETQRVIARISCFLCDLEARGSLRS